MRLNGVLASAGVGTALVLGAISMPAQAQAAGPAHTSASCYLYVDSNVGYINIRATKSSTGQLIARYTGTRLTPQSCEHEETGGWYRCSSGAPQYNTWAPVIYNGVKRYVAVECSGGWGA
ncbi:hypothetical protein ABT093_16420 [Kitasatospora sp. NPDC002551]|uniref:hypothetical protein n=1 Tax=Kitasatospora sp. NPDC002551 TaxID=3154539 RepID=UPI00332E5974